MVREAESHAEEDKRKRERLKYAIRQIHDLQYGKSTERKQEKLSAEDVKRLRMLLKKPGSDRLQ